MNENVRGRNRIFIRKKKLRFATIPASYRQRNQSRTGKIQTTGEILEMNASAPAKSPAAGELSAHLIAHINVKLALIGCPPVPLPGDKEFVEIAAAMAAQSREKDRLLGQHLCPADQRIQNFLHDYLQEMPTPKLPARTFTLDRAGLARVLSLPVDRDDFSSDIINSYRVKQGVLHNPKSDRRTTAGIFHVDRRRPADSRRQARRAENDLRQNARARAHAANGTAETAVHRHAAAAGGMFRLAADPAAGLPGGSRLHPGENAWKSASSCRAIS